jgi:hypothetical protein
MMVVGRSPPAEFTMAIEAVLLPAPQGHLVNAIREPSADHDGREASPVNVSWRRAEPVASIEWRLQYPEHRMNAILEPSGDQSGLNMALPRLSMGMSSVVPEPSTFMS